MDALHEPPAHFTLELHMSEAEGLHEALAIVRPRVCFFGHHHARVDATVAGVRTIGLNAVGYPGSLVGFEMTSDGLGLLGDWPLAASE